MSDPRPWLPEPDSSNLPYFEGAQQGKLRLQRCDDCKSWMFPVRKRCQTCGSTQLQWADASGRGRYVDWGARELGMVAALNGPALHGGVLPYAGAFLASSDSARASIRLQGSQRSPGLLNRDPLPRPS